jgi:hypothetical protein
VKIRESGKFGVNVGSKSIREFCPSATQQALLGLDNCRAVARFGIEFKRCGARFGGLQL